MQRYGGGHGEEQGEEGFAIPGFMKHGSHGRQGIPGFSL
jgi:hypothetical protein